MLSSKKYLNDKQIPENSNPCHTNFLNKIPLVLGESEHIDYSICLDVIFGDLYQVLYKNKLDDLSNDMDSQRFDIIIIQNYIAFDGLEKRIILNDQYEHCYV